MTADNATEENAVTVVEVTKPNTAQKGGIRISKSGEVFSSVTEADGIYQPVFAVKGLEGAVYEITAAEDIITPDGTLRYAAGEAVDTVTTDETGQMCIRDRDEAMAEMVDSVKLYGVLAPTLVRPKADGGYEMVAGHRRKCAATLAGITEMPCIVRNLTDDEATIIMVDSNLQRETILPSEKAFAYKMKLEAMKRQGQRSDLTSTPLEPKLKAAGLRQGGVVGRGAKADQRVLQRHVGHVHGLAV